MSNLLLDERPLIVLPSLAAMLNSLDEAVILQQIHYWIEKRQNYREGRYWVYNSMENWMQQFPWIKSRTTLTRYFNNLEKKGCLSLETTTKLASIKPNGTRLIILRCRILNNDCTEPVQRVIRIWSME